MITRRKTRQITLGNLKVGGDAPLTVQSMTKTDTRDVQATLLEIWALEAAGCDVVRCAVPVREAAEKLGEIKRQIRIPLVADIHFNYKLALIALEQGVDGLRLNPGNIGGKKFVMEVVDAGQGPEDPDPHRRERGVAREGSAREVRRSRRPRAWWSRRCATSTSWKSATTRR